MKALEGPADDLGGIVIKFFVRILFFSEEEKKKREEWVRSIRTKSTQKVRFKQRYFSAPNKLNLPSLQTLLPVYA